MPSPPPRSTSRAGRPGGTRAPGPADAAATRLLRLVLLACLVLALAALPWLSLAPNRLLPGRPVAALDALGPVAFLAGALPLAAEALRRRSAAGAGLLVLAGLLALLVATGHGAAVLLEGRTPSARAMLASGFWIAAVAAGMLLAEHGRAGPRGLAPALGAGLGLAVAAAAVAGSFDRLSLAVEAIARADLLREALLRHLALSAGALALAFAVSLPLGFAAFRSPRVEAAANAVLGATQVTPALALFGLLIPLMAGLVAAFPGLRGLGIGAIGPAPALIGVAVYLALPLMRGLVTGLRSADPAAVEAARAMGFTQARITREIRIPLALPVLAGALRVATVQSIGLVTLGGLIGAGGLGALVFEGMAQLAADLILLGALPIVALALVADGALALAARALAFDGAAPARRGAAA